MGRKKTTEQFVADARKVHGDKYGYDKCRYFSDNEKVTIVCPEHGIFRQKVSRHLRGFSCPKCQKVSSFTTGSFVNRAIGTHGDRYGYEKVVYIGSIKKVIITCHTHGDFQQTPDNHLKGHGCPKCADTWSGDGVVYVMCSPEGHNKIGIAKSGKEHNRLSNILKSQQQSAPTAITGLSLVCAYSFNDGSFTEAKRFEGKAHRHFKSRRKVFPDKFDGSREFFTVPVSEICSYLEQQGGKLVTIKQ